MNTTQKVAVGVAVALWVAAVWRITSAANSRLPPTRWTDFYTAAGPLEPPSWPHCHSPRLIDGEHVWSWCRRDAPDDYQGFVRFDLPDRRAELLWPFAEQDGQDALTVAAYAPGPAGDRFVAFGGPGGGQPAVARLAAEGGATLLGYPPGAPAQPIALWTDGRTVELLTGSWEPPVLHRRPVAEGSWASTPLPPPPCPPAASCRVEAGQREPGGWRLWAVRQPRGEGAAAALLERAPNGEWAVLQELPADAAPPEGGILRLDRSQGGGVLIGLSPGDRLLERVDGAWQPFTPPAVADTGLDVPDYRVEGEALAWTPDVHTPRDAQRVRGRWLMLRSTDAGYRLGSVDGAGGAPLSDDGWLASDPVLVPTPDGGFWVLGAFGTFVRVNDELDRIDAPGFFERVGLLYDDFRRLAWYNDFWLHLPLLKKAALPVVLGLLPLFGVVALFAGRGRRARRLATLSLVYILLAGAFYYWFWRLNAWI